MKPEEEKVPNSLSSPFIQRFLNKLPLNLRHEKITVVKVHEQNLEPVITLKIAETNYAVVHDIEQRRTRVYQGERVIFSEADQSEKLKDFLKKILDDQKATQY